MKRRPKIIVRMIHLEGPLKGQIQEYEESSIPIGRYQHCLVRFPPELSLISRDHAVITRDGNRFELIDHSKNGVYVNGRKIEERAFLKDGDILTFAYGGPKAAFLTEVVGEEDIQNGEMVAASGANNEMAAQEALSDPGPGYSEEVPIQKPNLSVVIKYGPMLKSSKTLPSVIGRSLQCDIALDHPNVFDRHIHIFFAEGQYWVKDLTGQSLVSLNGEPIHDQAALKKEDCLDLTPQGPRFRFLGEGRFFELPPSESTPPKEKPIWRLPRSIWTTLRRPSGKQWRN